MTQAFTYFEGYTTGAQPSDWTQQWTATDETWLVTDSATNSIRGKFLRHSRTTTARRFLAWDTPDGGSSTDTELLVRFRGSSITSADQLWLVVRGSGAAGTEQGYILRNTSTFPGTAFRISKLVGGTLTDIGATVAFPVFNSNEWYWARFRVNGSNLFAKIWAGEHESEPASWTLTRTDTDIAAAGKFGLGNIAAIGDRDFDAFAVGTGGDTAVFPVSPEARITQAPILVLETAPSEARITQVATLVLYEDAPQADVRITQAATLALAEFTAETRITQLATLVLADQVPCLTRWAQTWTITRKDGQVFAFTSLDRPLTFRGVVHQPCNSLAASAVELSTIVGVTGSIELHGILSDGGVSDVDLYNGLFDGANIEVWMVPWDNSGGEIPFRLMAGVTGASSSGETDFSQEILTPSAQLQQKALLETYTPGCRYQFGNQVDPRCPVDLVALTVTGSVTGTPIPNASTNATRRIFTDSTRIEADGFFNQGSLTWTTGPNAGAKSEVKDFTAGQFILWEALLFPIALTDAYSLTPSCDKSPASHLLFNPDMVDFGGFPHVPGSDALINTPDSRG